jgi:hypothetical protein
MDGFAYASQAGVLFAEDFDLPETAPEPEVIEPVFSAAELKESRSAAWNEGRAAGLREALADSATATQQTVTAIVEQLTAERAVSAARAEADAAALARLLLDDLAAALPTLCTQHGDAEVGAVIRLVLPALSQEPAITVRANPRTIGAIAQELARLDPDVAVRVQTIECDAMPPGDVRIAWHNGSAVRDAASLWKQISEVLIPIRETIDGG